MKPIALLSVLVVGLLAGQASGGPSFTLDKDSAMKLIAVEWSDATWPFGFNRFGGATDDASMYGGGPMQGVVGYIGILDDTNADSFASVRIGAKDYPGGVTAVIGTHDLSGYDDYELFLANDNDDPWEVKLYVETSSDYRENANWMTLTSGSHTTLTLGFTGLGGLTDVTDIGFLVAGSFQAAGGPSDPDVFHISAVAVPAPGAFMLVLLGLGIGLKWRRCA
jgi:hypothetical protein